MNEHRKYLRYNNQKKNQKQEEKIAELVELAKMLLANRKQLLIPEIIYVENALEEQLNKSRARIPNSVLRGIERKFLYIKEQLEKSK